ncbi:MAG: hypothetical protein ACK4UN_21450 [Limisphaerales bacterium]
MNENESLIRENFPKLLAHRQVKALTGIGGEWVLLNDEITAYHATTKNIETTIVITNGSRCIRVSGKIHRATLKLSNIEVQEI